MKIVIGADHNGLKLKNTLKGYLQERGAEVTDAGVYTEEPVDYPDIAWKVAEAVAAGTYDRGILICGTGIGMSIVANKVPGIRAAQCTDPYSAERPNYYFWRTGDRGGCSQKAGGHLAGFRI